MYEFLEHNAVYVVMFIVLMVWTGLFIYLYRIDRKIKELE